MPWMSGDHVGGCSHEDYFDTRSISVALGGQRFPGNPRQQRWVLRGFRVRQGLCQLKLLPGALRTIYAM